MVWIEADIILAEDTTLNTLVTKRVMMQVSKRFMDAMKQFVSNIHKQKSYSKIINKDIQ